MWSFSAWRRRRLLARHTLDPSLWASVCRRLPILDGLDATQLQRLADGCALFLLHKRLTALGELQLDDESRVALAAQACLPLLHLPEADWYRGFHELLLYPGDFLSPQRYRDEAGVEHVWDDARSGESWQHGPVILAWPGVAESGGWSGYNLVIHELAHKLDMLDGDANGLPPLHQDMRVKDWADALQGAYDDLNRQLDADPEAQTAIDPYAAENPAEFFAVTSEYFFSSPDLLVAAYPQVYRQLALFYRQDPLSRQQATHAPRDGWDEARSDDSHHA